MQKIGKKFNEMDEVYVQIFYTILKFLITLGTRIKNQNHVKYFVYYSYHFKNNKQSLIAMYHNRTLQYAYVK